MEMVGWVFGRKFACQRYNCQLIGSSYIFVLQLFTDGRWFLFYFGLLVYICVVGVFLYVFISMFVCLLIYFVCIPFLYLFIVYVMWLYFNIVSLKVYLRTTVLLKSKLMIQCICINCAIKKLDMKFALMNMFLP